MPRRLEGIEGVFETYAMEHIAALLLLVGCSDDMVQCRELAPQTALYESVEECKVALGPAVSAFVTKHPQVYGQCVDIDPAIEDEDVALVWDVKSDGSLVAMIEVSEVLVASGPENREKDYLRQE